MVSRSAYAGTYGVAFSGTAVVSDADPDQFLKNANGQAAVGVMTLSVPSSGPTSGRVLIFNAGLMYLGNAQGTLNAGNMMQPGKAKMTMMGVNATFVIKAGDASQSLVRLIKDSETLVGAGDILVFSVQQGTGAGAVPVPKEPVILIVGANA